MRDNGDYVGLIEATTRPDRVVFLAYFVFPRFMGLASPRKRARRSSITCSVHYDAVEIRAEMDYRNVPSRCLVEALGFNRRSHNKRTMLR
ncbi:MAG TPA: hypothetical protein VNE58_15320 [Casimicrobiaceae bacterium]|nr:hypothetical protein [Casimicrobiaceae bacterium]